MLERRDERELERLAPLVARLGSGRAVLDAERRVRIRLDPERRLRLVGPVVDRQHPLGAPGDRVEADVGRDPVQPRAQRAAPAESRQPAPRAQERVLERVVGVVQRAEHAVAVRVELGTLLLDEVIESWVHEGAHPTLDRPRAPGLTARSVSSCRVRGRTDRDAAPPSPIPSCTSSCAPTTCRARAPSTRSSSAGPRRACAWARAATWRSCWPRGSRAAWSSATASSPSWLPYVEVPDIVARHRAGPGPRRGGAARAARGPSRLAQRARGARAEPRSRSGSRRSEPPVTRTRPRSPGASSGSAAPNPARAWPSRSRRRGTRWPS